MAAKMRVAMLGSGGMARSHLRQMLALRDAIEVVAVSDPSQAAYEETVKTFELAGVQPAPYVPDLETLIDSYAGQLDAALVCTPHAQHHAQATALLEAGVDVLLEKPMVLNVPEALDLIATRDRTGRLLVIAFQGSLSPAIRMAANMISSGELGTLLSIAGTVWQDWGELSAGTWRADPALSGGGFLFDTGAHMLNTIAHLAGQDFAEVAAWTLDHGRPVETQGVVMGRLKGGALVTINAVGEAIQSCESDIRVFGTLGILRTGQWGERLELQKAGESVLSPVTVPPSIGVWEQFLKVRAGEIENPSPPEIGLRMTRLWDAIKASAARGGQVVTV